MNFLLWSPFTFEMVNYNDIGLDIFKIRLGWAGFYPIHEDAELKFSFKYNRFFWYYHCRIYWKNFIERVFEYYVLRKKWTKFI